MVIGQPAEPPKPNPPQIRMQVQIHQFFKLRSWDYLVCTGRQGLVTSHLQKWGKAGPKKRRAMSQKKVHILEVEQLRSRAVKLAFHNIPVCREGEKFQSPATCNPLKPRLSRHPWSQMWPEGCDQTYKRVRAKNHVLQGKRLSSWLPCQVSVTNAQSHRDYSRGRQQLIGCGGGGGVKTPDDTIMITCIMIVQNSPECTLKGTHQAYL